MVNSVNFYTGVLQVMHNRIQSLLSTTERIRSKVSEPFNRITIRMNQLIRLQETCDMLRRVIRILYLTKRLRAQLKGGARELTKTAQSLSELSKLWISSLKHTAILYGTIIKIPKELKNSI